MNAAGDSVAFFDVIGVCFCLVVQLATGAKQSFNLIVTASDVPTVNICGSFAPLFKVPHQFVFVFPIGCVMAFAFNQFAFRWGEIEASKIGRRIVYMRVDLIEFLERNRWSLT